MTGIADLRFFFERPAEVALADASYEEAHESLLEGLESGTLRAAERGDGGEWSAVAWVKSAILLGFRAFPTIEMPGPAGPAFDRGAFPPRILRAEDGVRLVPGGSAARRGAYLAPGVVIMPPAYVNVGAWVGEETMVDSHALVGSCAQIGARVHLSAGAQIGGVLEPAGSVPVVVEDEAFVGAQCGVFEGVRVGRRAVLAPGVQLTASTVVFDTVNGRTWKGEVPEGAVLVPGSRPAGGSLAASHGLHVYAPVITKYRDARTDAATALEESLR